MTRKNALEDSKKVRFTIQIIIKYDWAEIFKA